MNAVALNSDNDAGVIETQLEFTRPLYTNENRSLSKCGSVSLIRQYELQRNNINPVGMFGRSVWLISYAIVLESELHQDEAFSIQEPGLS